MVYSIEWNEMRDKSDIGVCNQLWVLLDKINNYCGEKLIIHRLRDKEASHKSQHYWGRAADAHISEMHVLDQYALVERFSPPGLGIYPKDVWTYTPGFHVDVRDLPDTGSGSRWGYKGKADGGRTMVAIGRDLFQHIIELDK